MLQKNGPNFGKLGQSKNKTFNFCLIKTKPKSHVFFCYNSENSRKPEKNQSAGIINPQR